MTEQNKKIPFSSNEVDFNVADFGEPTHETMLAFADTLESLKQLARNRGRFKSMRLDGDPYAEKISGTLDNYMMRLDGDKELFVNVFDANPEVMAKMGPELSDSGTDLVFISYYDTDIDIVYQQRYGEDPALYVRSKHEQVKREATDRGAITSTIGAVGLSMDAATPELAQEMHAYFEAEAEARRLGLIVPTEGTMKQLIGAINGKIAELPEAEK